MGHRVENWPTVLADLVQENRDRAFEWGSFDCCIWPAMVKDSMTGSNLVEQMAALYSDRAGADKLIEDAGGFEELISQHLGEPVSAKLIGRGDVALIEHENGKSLAIFDGQYAIATGKNGLKMLKRSVILKGWKI